MHRKSVLARVGLFALWVGCAVVREEAQATLIADAHVNAALPSMNSGGISNVAVGGGYIGLLQFDLSLLPAVNASPQVSRAVLELYVNRLDTTGSFAVQPILTTWTESTVTYATMPLLGPTTQMIAVSRSGSFVAIDVTALVQGWMANPSANFGVALTAASAAFAIDSKENDLTGHGATLVVSLNTTPGIGPTGPAGLIGPQGPPGANGAKGIQGGNGIQGLTGAEGPTGSAGVEGSPGVAGTNGLPGLTGPVGPQGPAGTNGVGANGLVYQGEYESWKNYGLGQVVLWQGASWTSLQTINQANAPDQSPTFWGPLAAQGPPGSQGLSGSDGASGLAGLPGLQGIPGQPGTTGPAGQQGQQGQQGQMGVDGAIGPAGQSGTTGPTGPMGAVGVQGIAGPVGLSFAGAYDSSRNYSLAEGVSFRGAGYVSLLQGNHGNEPNESPEAWALFAAAGAAGAVGSTGADGLQGPSGPVGASGAVGQTGSVGPQGEPGPSAIVYRGNYSSATNYGLADAVSDGGTTYVSLGTNNVGNTPDQSFAAWAVLAAQGVPGVPGATGPAGAMGQPGLAGSGGLIGPAGPPLTFLGEWLAGMTYAAGDAVSFGGSAFISVLTNTGFEPDSSPAYWGLLASAGNAGSNGPAGLTGAQGLNGFAGPQGITGSPGPAGALGPAGLTWRGSYSVNATYGRADAVLFNGATYLSLSGGNAANQPDVSPVEWTLLAAAGATGASGATGSQGLTGSQGMAGVPGVAGAAGPAGVDFRGPWGSGSNYPVGAAVTFLGSTYLATTANAAVEPDENASIWTVLAQAGATGRIGVSGNAATVQIGTVTSAAPGGSAAVSNSGTDSAAILNFTIPQGAPGAAGTGGSSSGVGSGFGSMVHQVSYAAVYYAVNNPNQSASEDASVLSWVPNGCNATGLQVFSQQGSTITVTLRVGTPGAMADSSLSCQVSTGGTCSATGAINVSAGSFVDLVMTHADSVAQGVWTALSCQ